MNFAMMLSANRHREFVADLATKHSGLGEADVVGVGWLTTADHAPLLRDEL
jgi:hypothetical protein